MNHAINIFSWPSNFYANLTIVKKNKTNGMLMCHKRDPSDYFSLYSCLCHSPGDMKNERKNKKWTNQFVLFSFFLLSLSLLTSIHRIYIYIYIRPSTSIIHIFFFDRFTFLLKQMTRTSTSRMESTKKTKSNLTKIELKKLKSILPTLQQKPSSTPIEIVLETIRYIRQLEDQLIDRFHTGIKTRFFLFKNLYMILV